EEFRGDVFVNWIFTSQLQRDAQHVEAKHSHPACAIALLKAAAVRERCVAIEHADVIEPQETALENVVALGIFAVHPPGKGDEHFMENSLEECAIAFAASFSLDLVNAPRRPRNDGRINITEIPFVCGDLTVWMLIPLAHDEIELALSKFRIHQCQWNAMKSEVPRCVPWEFPLIRHRHDTLVVEMTPSRVASLFTFLRRRGKRGITIQPLLYDVMVELFAPKHSRECLALDCAMLPA